MLDAQKCMTYHWKGNLISCAMMTANCVYNYDFLPKMYEICDLEQPAKSVIKHRLPTQDDTTLSIPPHPSQPDPNPYTALNLHIRQKTVSTFCAVPGGDRTRVLCLCSPSLPTELWGQRAQATKIWLFVVVWSVASCL